MTHFKVSQGLEVSQSSSFKFCGSGESCVSKQSISVFLQFYQWISCKLSFQGSQSLSNSHAYYLVFKSLQVCCCTVKVFHYKDQYKVKSHF